LVVCLAGPCGFFMEPMCLMGAVQGACASEHTTCLNDS
jgi:hypothetical protein